MRVAAKTSTMTATLTRSARHDRRAHHRRLSSTDLDALTGKRDRVVDLLRIVSLIVVIAGHSIMLTVYVRDGHIDLGNLLADRPAPQALTWLLQILPLFFFAGAAAATYGWRDGPDGHTPGQWLFARSQRLLRPVFWYLLAVGLLLVVLHGLPAVALGDVVARLSVQLLWFLGAYLLVLAVVPVLQRISTTRHALAAVAACWGLTAAIDIVRFALGIAGAGYLNFLTVWTIPAVLGISYAKGLLTVRLAAVVAALAFVVDVALVVVGPYDVSLVTVPGQHISNMGPPSLLLAGHTIVLCALATALRGPLARLVSRPRIWFAVAMGNRGAMTLYLWHLPVLALIIGIGMALGYGRSQPLSVGHLVIVVVQTCVLLAAMVPVVGALSGLENRPLPWWDERGARRAPRVRDAATVVAIVVVAVATLMVARFGLGGDGLWWLAVGVGAAAGARLLRATPTPH